jgi:hypothetical protein
MPKKGPRRHGQNCDTRHDMTQKPRPKPDDPEQSKRFIETAEETGADDEKALERAFKRIAPRRRESKED